jgi:hypothetical protein
VTDIPAHYVASACTGKHPFASWSAAQATLRRAKKTRDAKGMDRPALRVYRCTICGRYHIGGVD